LEAETIPDDLMRTAHRLFDRWTLDAKDREVAVPQIAEGLMEERERCAKVAEYMLRFADTTSEADIAIPAAIRKGAVNPRFGA
jgi:hypothetical protein